MEKQNHSNILILLRDIAISVIIIFIIFSFVKPVTVKGESMQNTYKEKDVLIINKKAYSKNRDIKKGDVIVFNTREPDENGKNKSFIKRVVAVDGDYIEIKDGNVYVNDYIQDEEYTKDNYTSGNIENQRVPDDYLFVLGDNRECSKDSRDIGFVSKDEVIGKIVFQLYPFSKTGLIK